MLCIARKDKIFDVHLDARQIHFCIVRCPLLSLALCEGGKKNHEMLSKIILRIPVCVHSSLELDL